MEVNRRKQNRAGRKSGGALGWGGGQPREETRSRDGGEIS